MIDKEDFIKDAIMAILKNPNAKIPGASVKDIVDFVINLYDETINSLKRDEPNESKKSEQTRYYS